MESGRESDRQDPGFRKRNLGHPADQIWEDSHEWLSHWNSGWSCAKTIQAILVWLWLDGEGWVGEIEHLEAIADGRGVQGHVGIVIGGDGIGHVVTAAAGEGFQAPVALDELDD